MKALMTSHLEVLRHTMFEAAAEGVQAQLEAMADSLRRRLTVLSAEMCTRLKQDFRAAMVAHDETDAEGEFRCQLEKPLCELQRWFAVQRQPKPGPAP